MSKDVEEVSVLTRKSFNWLIIALLTDSRLAKELSVRVYINALFSSVF